MMNRIGFGLIASALLAAPAFAQAQAPAQPQGQAPASGTTMQVPMNQAPMNQGAGTAMQGSDVQYITQNRSDLWRASRLEGVNVYNQNDERIGDISEVLVNRQGQVEAVVIGVGGFLGMGERSVAVPYDAIQWQQSEDRVAATPSTTGAAGTTGATTMGATGSTNAAGTNTAMTNSTMQQPETTGSVGTGYQATAGDRMRDYPERAILPNATKEQLENAPEFRFANQ
ncbi:PRC-barrel domain-containing protein [Microvirga splendida]|uniref:PRC-barrel domain-containing protein n=1 Tax=Microvirga splendida TaxID=2795727 RepID=A0ABS0Y5N6_9HYPH|nr:PRC-barrel domain-containing protein [Microvirga splendida]MBJ6127594.1 PRC-barrel domain-containing protein [Microvirga splendida]